MQEEIFASSFAAAAYLKSIDFPKDKKVGSYIQVFIRLFLALTIATDLSYSLVYYNCILKAIDCS